MQLSEELARLFANLGPAFSRMPDDGLRNLDYLVLAWMANRASLDGVRLSDLAEARGFDVSTMSRRVAHLVGSGMVERQPDPGDRRAQLLHLTEAGRAAVAKERSRRVRLITETLDDWSEEDKSQLARMLSRLNQNLELSL
ncbi:MarR family transcriptional regulator [Tessaracoccus sp. OS52]|uniref:MarR family winged helix-turn-helix transcriptional regulator n=1 Tax=Tessaracoccus sp. OS52 TaxID=2886691 RepID=UPI001D11675F|nr:MarR family transcriptional regulator [Tessaracoccus sp. OS52]MCC2594161.1 MarR family transcriptional regulator [Tessaracoccus sp. OS52]